MKNYIFIVLILGSQNPLFSQAITQDDVLHSWDIMTKMVVESAKLMPEEDFAFSPGEPLRNFANQLNHTTSSNIGFSKSVKAGKPNFKMPSRKNPPQDKATVIDLLEKSFVHFRKGLENLSNDDLSAKVPWGRGGKYKITRLKAILIVMSHMQREHGKTIMYLRAKGITPTPSGSWSFD